MVLYALVVAFLSFTVTTYLRFRDLETRYTRLARRLALDEALRDFPDAAPHVRAGGAPRPQESGSDLGDVLDEPGGRD
jgi:hypothetical protein